MMLPDPLQYSNCIEKYFTCKCFPIESLGYVQIKLLFSVNEDDRI